MKVSYFPGCTLKNKARDLDDYARKSAEVLGITLEEIEDWQCCGGVFTTLPQSFLLFAHYARRQKKNSL